MKDHNGRDYSSHLVKHAEETDHLPVDTANFELIRSGHCNNARSRRIAEALLIKKLKPTLNIQEKSVPLKLFNYFNYLTILTFSLFSTPLCHNVTSYRANFH